MPASRPTAAPFPPRPRDPGAARVRARSPGGTVAATVPVRCDIGSAPGGVGSAADVPRHRLPSRTARRDRGRPGGARYARRPAHRGREVAVLPAAGAPPAARDRGVSPLIAVMQDQQEKLEALAVPTAKLDSTPSASAERRNTADAQAGRPDLVYGAARGRRPPREHRTRRRLAPGRGRGALRVAVGTRLPPRVPRHPRCGPRARPPAGPGPHRDRDAGRRRGHRASGSPSTTRWSFTPASSGRTSASRCTGRSTTTPSASGCWPCSTPHSAACSCTSPPRGRRTSWPPGSPRRACRRDAATPGGRIASVPTRSAASWRASSAWWSRPRRSGSASAGHPGRGALARAGLDRDLRAGGGPGRA